MHPRVAPLAEIARLNTRLFENCLDGVDRRSAERRLGDTNHLAFLACHLLDARTYLVNYLGTEARHPFQEMLAEATTLEEIVEFPPLDEVKRAWRRVAELLEETLDGLDEETLGNESPTKFPVADGTILGGLAFLMQHESYHVGQMALLRKHHGFGAMAY